MADVLGSCTIMSSSQAPATGIAVASALTYIDGACTMMQTSSLAGLGSNADVSASLTLTLASATATFSTIIH